MNPLEVAPRSDSSDSSLASVGAFVAQRLPALQAPASLPEWSRFLADEVCPLVPCAGLVAVLARVAAGHIRIHFGTSAGVDRAPLQRAMCEPQALADRPLAKAWLASQRALWIDPDHSDLSVSELEIAERERFGLGRMVLHGVVGASGADGSYFSFVGIANDSAGSVVPRVEMLVPHLHLGLLSLWRTHCSLVRHGVSDEERRLLQQLSLGRSNREIAERTCRSPATVRNRLHHLSVKLGARSRVQLVDRARECGLLDLV